MFPKCSSILAAPETAVIRRIDDVAIGGANPHVVEIAVCAAEARLKLRPPFVL